MDYFTIWVFAHADVFLNDEGWSDIPFHRSIHIFLGRKLVKALEH